MISLLLNRQIMPVRQACPRKLICKVFVKISLHLVLLKQAQILTSRQWLDLQNGVGKLKVTEFQQNYLQANT